MWSSLTCNNLCSVLFYKMARLHNQAKVINYWLIEEHLQTFTKGLFLPYFELYNNPFKPNGISHGYKFDQSISVLRLVEWYFTFLFKFQLNTKQTVEPLIRRRVMRRLIWSCTVCICPTKRTLGLYGLNAFEKSVNLHFKDYINCSDSEPP